MTSRDIIADIDALLRGDISGPEQVRGVLEKALPYLWLPIETAPKDGTRIDLFFEGRRHTDCYWGKPDHCCGEAGRYCDDEWHGETEWWVDSTFNEFLWRDEEPTHWMPIIAPTTEDPTHG